VVDYFAVSGSTTIAEDDSLDQVIERAKVIVCQTESDAVIWTSERCVAAVVCSDGSVIRLTRP
jgi:hypothetical protein